MRPPSDETGQPTDGSLGDVAAAARELREAEEHHRLAASRLADALLSAHERGSTWAVIARAAELGSAETARIRAYRARDRDDVPPALRWQYERGSAPRPSPPTVGLSVTAAADQLEVSRKTVYAWIRSGKLAATTDETGRTRVLLDED